jgi:exonuclease VII large subunit
LRITEQRILGEMSEQFWASRSELDKAQTILSDYFSLLFTVFQSAAGSVRAYVPMLEQALVRAKKESEESIRLATSRYRIALSGMEEMLKKLATELETHNPLRQLKLGYSILSQGKDVLRSVKGKHSGEPFSARLSDGTLEATITAVTPL